MEHNGILNIIEILMLSFYFIYFHDFFQTCPNGRQPTFFVYWFLDEVRSIKKVQKTSRLFWIYISIYTHPIWLIHVFLFFNFYCNIYNVTNPIIDVYQVNNGKHYQCQKNVLAHTGIMRRRSIFEDINRLSILWFTTLLTYINRNSSDKMT